MKFVVLVLLSLSLMSCFKTSYKVGGCDYTPPTEY